LNSLLYNRRDGQTLGTASESIAVSKLFVQNTIKKNALHHRVWLDRIRLVEKSAFHGAQMPVGAYPDLDPYFVVGNHVGTVAAMHSSSLS
jgi:hypothetical protein